MTSAAEEWLLDTNVLVHVVRGDTLDAVELPWPRESGNSRTATPSSAARFISAKS